MFAKPYSARAMMAAVALSSCQSKDEDPHDSVDVRPDPVEGAITSRALPVRESLAANESIFELLDPGESGIDFGLHWDDPAGHLKEFLFLNPVGGVCVGDYDGDGLPDLYVTSPS